MTKQANYPIIPLNETFQRIQETLQEIRDFLVVDRVVLYEFLKDGSGEVVAEALSPQTTLSSLLHLRFPASDIPEYARSRFLNQRVRILVDVGLEQQLQQFPNGGSQQVVYDAPSQCHLNYLRQLNVQGSLTYPIIIESKLWGLLIIHHRQSQSWQRNQLAMVELLHERLTLLITTEQLSQSQNDFLHREQTIKTIRQLLNSETHCSAMTSVLETVVNCLQGHSGRLYLQHLSGETEIYKVGKQPQETVLEETETWQQGLVSGDQMFFSAVGGSVIAYDLWFDGDDPMPYSALVVPLCSPQHQQAYLTIFRPNPPQEIWWAGQPPQTAQQRQELRPSFTPYLEHRQLPAIDSWRKQEIKLACAIAQLLGDVFQQQDVLSVAQGDYHPLTGLPNRKRLTEDLNALSEEAVQSKQVYGVIFLDLDRFQQVNNILGHTAGDQLLKLVADRLKQHLAERDHWLAHWSGDQFVIVLRHLTALDSGEIDQLVSAIGNCFETPFTVFGQAVYMKASWGAAIAPYDGTDAETLLLNAETAMYAAKQQGKNRYQVYSPALRSSLNPLTLEAELRQALDNNALALFFQPQVALLTGEVTAVEALIRWPHPNRGILSPCDFIPFAEETDLICDLGNWILATACQQLAQWREQGLDDIRVAVNISARHFQQANFVDTVKQVLHESNVPAWALEIEITETIAADNVEFTEGVLQQLQQLGVHVALDDFGMGYSSLHAIKHFSFNTLKIDRAFIRDLPNCLTDGAIVNSVMVLAQGLNLRVVAEGVETLSQLETLQSLLGSISSQQPFLEVQGYLVSKPLPADEAMTFLWNSRSENLLSALDKEKSMLSNLSGVATRNARFSQQEDSANQSPLQQLFNQTYRERLVAQIAQQVHASLDLQEIFQVTVKQIRDFLATDRVLLYQFQADWRGKVVTESVTEEWKSLLNQEIDDPCFETKCAPLYSNGRVLAIADVEQAEMTPCYRKMLDSFQVRANLVIPILHQTRLWGLLIAHHCRSPRDWHPSEVSLLEQLATQVGVAIHQAELYQQLQQANQELEELAIKDGLTKIPNRRWFDYTLDKQWQRLKQEQDPLSLILCDIDDFKSFNDYYGHQAGDECLIKIATTLQNLVHCPDDLVARYGGEEFVILLPNTAGENALLVAERARKTVAELSIDHAQSSVVPYVTLSLGVASVTPTPEISRKQLIRQADDALYKAKAAGRDRAIFND